MNYKLNLGYFFTKNLGVDLGFTLLKGPKQLMESHLYEVARVDASSNATATAIGFAPSLVYKMDNGLYGRIGLATKIGGQTDVDVYNKSPRDANTYSVTTAKAVVNGKIPLGLTSALGYTKTTSFGETYTNEEGTGLTSVSNYSSLGLSVGISYSF